MNIPGYDAWRLQGPHDRDDPALKDCPECNGQGWMGREDGLMWDCPDCEGMGEVEAEIEEPDGDYEYERRRDAKWESEQ